MADKGTHVFKKDSLSILMRALGMLEGGFSALPPFRPDYAIDPEAGAILIDVAFRLHGDYPYFHPLYTGQMLKPPHPLARAAYALAMWINPKNHALDVAQASL
jgi:tyrosine decarboxylase / aspartate 1-decarboxylase